MFNRRTTRAQLNARYRAYIEELMIAAERWVLLADGGERTYKRLDAELQQRVPDPSRIPMLIKLYFPHLVPKYVAVDVAGQLAGNTGELDDYFHAIGNFERALICEVRKYD